MKQLSETVGIDVSKSTLDAHLHIKNVHAQFDNNKKGYARMMKWIKSQTSVCLDEILFCFEHTGIYSSSLATFLTTGQLKFVIVPALEIKKSMGLVRGKNDKADAKRIAQYAYLRRDVITLTVLPSAIIQALSQLLSLRERMVSQRAGYKASLKEFKAVFKKTQNLELFAGQESMIKALNKEIKALEEKILGLIDSDETIKKTYHLLTSVKGIGPVVAAHLIAVTNCFINFDDSRKLACYCGIAPFEKQSGSSLKSKSKVNHYANKRMKALLDRAACSAIQADIELKKYYQRRVNQGKSKMSTINIVRNKLLHRAFAVVKRGTPYVEIFRHAA